MYKQMKACLVCVLWLVALSAACQSTPETNQPPDPRPSPGIRRAPRTPVTGSQDMAQTIPCITDKAKYPPVCGVIPQQTEDADVFRQLGRPTEVWPSDSVRCERWDYYYPGDGRLNVEICNVANKDKRIVVKVQYTPYSLTLAEVLAKFGEPEIVRLGPPKSDQYASAESYSLIYWPQAGLVVRINSGPPFRRDDLIHGIAYFDPREPQTWEETYGPASDYPREFAWEGFSSKPRVLATTPTP